MPLRVERQLVVDGPTFRLHETMTAVDGTEVDLSEIPGPGTGRAMFACRTDFDEPFFSLVNPRLGFGITVRWPAEIFPHAWFWQEMHASPGFPWYRRAYVVVDVELTRFAVGQEDALDG